jgi:hypothetical protein
MFIVGAVGFAFLLSLNTSGKQPSQVQGKNLYLESPDIYKQEFAPGEPDGSDISYVTSSTREVIPGGPGFQMVSALQFKPWHPETAWDFYYLDLYNPGTEFGSYSAALTLPNNITITRMVVYFYDNSVNDLNVLIWFGNQTGGWGQLVNVWSSGAYDGYRTVIDDTIDFPDVDQQSYSYVIEARITADSTNLRLAGVRIDYAFVNDLPLVIKGD